MRSTKKRSPGARSVRSGGELVEQTTSDEQAATQLHAASNTAPLLPSFTIPENLPPDKLNAAKFYRDELRWAVHPLHGPTDKNVAENFRGKKPLRRNWKQHVASEATDELLEEYFANGYDANLGVVIRSPHVVVDLDSKQDSGESVVSFISNRPELQAIPRERTAGGVHLHFRCLDLPPITKQGKRYEKALESKVADGVNAEFFFDGGNLAIAPSIHRSGASYQWEVKGEIPVWPWEKLKSAFGFRLPDEHCESGENSKSNRKKEGDWKATFKGDLGTLDIVQLTRELTIYGEPIDPDKHSHSVQCFWSDQHSAPGEWNSSDSSTAIFEGQDKRLPGFKCLHVSHGEKSLKEFLQQCEERRPGIVDQCCARMRVWVEGQAAIDGRPRVILPGFNHADSGFATECGAIMGPKKIWFRKSEFVVEVQRKRFNETIQPLAFHIQKAIEVRSSIEEYIEVGKLASDEDDNKFFAPTSMADADAAMLIHSPQFKRQLPEITRVLAYQIPIIHCGRIVFPRPDFDDRFGIYTDPQAPAIVDMNQREALMWLHELTKEFCFDGPQSLTHYFARLLTPMCRAIIGWDARCPFWIFSANRERLGKDYLAAIVGLLYDGYPNEDAPLEPRNSTETRKRITSAILAGRTRMHFANCAGHIQDGALEQAITSACWGDRVLGSNTDISLPNELELSMSGNVGVVSYRGDLAYRARHIRLYYPHENPNARRFHQPNLHQWVREHRAEILSALATPVINWVKAGQPKYTTPFASFPRWAEVVGGVMLANGLGDPCLPEQHLSIGGDEEARDMKNLFNLGHEKFENKRVELKSIIGLINDGDGQHCFGWLDLTSRAGQTIFGKMLRRYDGRIFENIILKIHPDRKRPRFSFETCDGSTFEPSNAADQLFAFRGAVAVGDIVDIEDISPSAMKFEETANVVANGRQTVLTTGSALLNVIKVPEVPQTCAGYDFVTTTAVYPEIASAIQAANSVVALDLETTSLEPWKGEIRLLSLAIPDREAWVIDLGKTGYDLGELHGALQSSLLIGHNIKFDLLWLLVRCGLRCRNVFCTMTAARLLHAGSLAKNGLDDVLDQYLNLQLPSDESRSDWSQSALTREQLAYAANDVVHLSELKAVLEGEIADAKLREVCDLEMRLLPIVVDMENYGFLVDQPKLKGFLEKAQTGATEAKRKLCELVGKPDLKVNSHVELKRVLTSLGLELEDTKAETLAAFEHPATHAITEYRGAVKRVEQAKALLRSIGCDGRIHTCFNPTGTDTGRFSSSRPNLQNIGRGEIRSCFIAAPGCKLVVADYSQIELRAAAVLAGEERMIEAYRNKEDLHLKTAAVVLKREVTRADRQLAKAVNFGLLYGQGAEGLQRYARNSYGVEISRDQAEQIRSSFFDEYKSLRSWHAEAWNGVNHGILEVRTKLGRRRLLRMGADQKWNRFTALVNTPVQGSCADAMKIALIRIAERLPQDARLISTIHDEVIVESAAEKAEEVKQLIVEAMIEAMNELFPEVPTEVEAKICDNWGGK